jgi:predicted GIY-YIG superfamily endonuclease
VKPVFQELNLRLIFTLRPEFSEGLQDRMRRHYIGSTIDLERRLSEHRNGGTLTTQRLGDQLEIVAFLELDTIEEARILERKLKRKKNPKLAIAMLNGLRLSSDPL